ncbi:MAG: glycosyltransferase family 4 protein [Acidobacteriaceae bacterium]
MIRILADDRWRGFSGIGRHAEEIIVRVPHDMELIGLGSSWSIQDPTSPIRLSAAIRRKTPDVFWSPGFIPPLRSPAPFVFTIHDLIHLRLRTMLHAAYFNSVIRPLCRDAARILTVSEFSRSEICEWGKLSPDKVVVIPNGVSKEFRPEGPRKELGGPYIFYAGSRKRHKNLRRLIGAYAISGLSKDHYLALSGNPDVGLLSLAASLGVGGRLIFTGHLSELEMAAAYRGATAVVLVSTCEGFGLPAVEAMACGTPVVVSNCSALPEIVGAAGVFVDPYSVESIAQALCDVAYKPKLRQECSSAGLKRSSEFNWDRTATAVWKILREAAEPGRTKC